MDRTAETAKCEKTRVKTAGRRREEGKERAEGRRSSGAALKRTKSKGREGSRGEKVSVLGCTREH